MKIKNIIFTLLATTLLGSCVNEIVYTPTVGGAVDTLHNEIHVASASVFEDVNFIMQAEAGKVYITDSDGFKYTFDPTISQFVLAEDTDTIINFYFDNNQTTRFVDGSDGFQVQLDSPIYSIKWYKLKPLLAFGINKEIVDKLKTQEFVESLGEIYGFYPRSNTKFVGWSIYPSCLGDYEHLWDFQNNYKQQAVTSLYGVWVEE